MTLDPDRQALYDELHAAHAAVQAAKAAYTEAANRRRAAALALAIGPTDLANALGSQSVSSAHAIPKAAVDGKLPATEHRRKTKKPKADVPTADVPTAVVTLNLITGVESVDNAAEADAPPVVGATF